MYKLPTICDDCGVIFPSGFAFGGSGTVISIGNRSGPCPNCGGMGSVQDGIYRIVEKAIEVFSNPERTIEELYNFKNILKNYQNDTINFEEVVDQVNEVTPNLNPLLEYIQPKTRAEKFQYGFLIVTTALGLFTNAMANQQPTTTINQEIVINQIYETNQNIYQTNLESNKIKIGRNEICPCGSGLKYKRCHGK